MQIPEKYLTLQLQHYFFLLKIWEPIKALISDKSSTKKQLITINFKDYINIMSTSSLSFTKMFSQTFLPNTAPRQPSLEGSPVRLYHLSMAPCVRINKVLGIVDVIVGEAELHQSIVGPPAVGVNARVRLHILSNQTYI